MEFASLSSIPAGMSLSRSSLDLPRSCQHGMYRLVSCPESNQHQRFTRSMSGQSAQSEPTGHGHGHFSSTSSTPSTLGSSFFGDNSKYMDREKDMKECVCVCVCVQVVHLLMPLVNRELTTSDISMIFLYT